MKPAKRKVEAVPAYAWEFSDPPVLCSWAQPERYHLERDAKPSPEARPVRVRIMREADYLRLLKGK